MGDGNAEPDGTVYQLADTDPDPAARSAQYLDMLRDLAATEGVEGVSLTSPGALVGLGTVDWVETDCGQCFTGGIFLQVAQTSAASHSVVSPDTFAVLGIPLVAGTRLHPRRRLEGAASRHRQPADGGASFRERQPARPHHLHGHRARAVHRRWRGGRWKGAGTERRPPASLRGLPQHAAASHRRRRSARPRQRGRPANARVALAKHAAIQHCAGTARVGRAPGLHPADDLVRPLVPGRGHRRTAARRARRHGQRVTLGHGARARARNSPRTRRHAPAYLRRQCSVAPS